MILTTTFRTGLAAATLTIAGLPALADGHETNVVASFSLLGDMVEKIVGQHATVSTIVGPDADMHVLSA